MELNQMMKVAEQAAKKGIFVFDGEVYKIVEEDGTFGNSCALCTHYTGVAFDDLCMICTLIDKEVGGKSNVSLRKINVKK